MKRECHLCRAHYTHWKVKVYAHGLKLCGKCRDVLLDHGEEAITLQRYRR
jgi:Zn-finger nucleic acid-binding protein